MDVSLYSAASAMNATERWQDLIAENLSMSGVPGAHARAMSFSAVAAGQATVANHGVVLPQANVSTDFSQGELRGTGNPMDCALQGPGFFTVEREDGSKAFTRDGEFTINRNGQLVTKQGLSVLNDNGSPIRSDPASKSAVTISQDGVVSQGPEIKGKLGIVEIAKPQNLIPVGGGIFRNDDPNVLPVPSLKTQVRSGFEENSNVSPTLAMATMITAMRMFESNQKAMQMGGERMSKAITELSGVN
jgi:flagellar basal body rod protein FlgG